MHPQQNQFGQGQLPQAARGYMAAHALTAVLQHPYAHAQQFTYPQASHYAQAYAAQPGPSNAAYRYGATTTTGGYTLSSTYVPGSGAQSGFQAELVAGGSSNRPSRPPSQAQAYWYQPGNCRCAKAGCSFVGSKKAVETHMMDRHLIYPSGWENKKRKPDWDADPSLKGKPVPIQGTNMKLDTPEQIEAWIAERKKRFPTADRVQEKEKKLEEAIARGQLSPLDSRFAQRKKRRTDEYQSGGVDGGGRGQRGRGRGQFGNRGRGRGRGRGHGGGGFGDGGGEFGRQDLHVQHESRHEAVPSTSTLPAIQHQLPPRPAFTYPESGENPSKEVDANSDEEITKGSNEDSDSDSDSAPEVVSSKAPPGLVLQDEVEQEHAGGTLNDVPESMTVDSKEASRPLGPPRKPLPRYPRAPPRNPFAPRSSLLRNLLTPEIRMTVSNLSQAIRFLVDNDFLENVELKPGQANERKIEVLDASPTEESTP